MKSRQFTLLSIVKTNYFVKFFLIINILIATNFSILAYSPNTAGNFSQNEFDTVNNSSSIVAAPEYKQKGFFTRSPKMETSKEQFEYAQTLEKNKKYKAATKAYNALIIEWPASPEAPTAQLGVARTYEIRGKMLDAFKEYQYLINNYDIRHLPENISFTDIVNSQFRIANYYLNKLDSSFLGFGSIGVDGVADAFAQIAKNAPEWALASECLLRKGLAYEIVGKNVEAILEYEDLIGRYGGTTIATEAFYRAAIARYHIALKTHRDEKILRNTIVAMNLALQADPSHQYASATIEHRKKIEEMLTALLYEKAQFYDKIKRNNKAALISYKSFVKEFPQANEASKAQQRITELESIID
jgi:TolA-binding protein